MPLRIAKASRDIFFHFILIKNPNKALYIALGINLEGRKEVLGMYLSENEGAKFWMGVLSDLKSRGVRDILFAYMDGLTDFPEAVRVVFPPDKSPAVHRPYGEEQHKVRKLQGPQGFLQGPEEDLRQRK